MPSRCSDRPRLEPSNSIHSSQSPQTRARDPILTRNHIQMFQVGWKLMPLSRSHFLELCLQLRLEHCAVNHVANTSRAALVVTNRALLLIDLPRRAHAITPVFW